MAVAAADNVPWILLPQLWQLRRAAAILPGAGRAKTKTMGP